MATITFWGKPGCIGNARQVALLRASGHVVEIRDLRAEPWTKERLRAFFGDHPIAAWFNQAAPKVKRGELRPELLSESDALTALIAEPLLIRRPLLECDGRVEVGFDQIRLATWIGLTDAAPGLGECCPRVDMPPCRT